MNLIGPKSVAAKLHLVVKIAFFLAVARALTMLAIPVLPNGWHQYLSFEVRSGVFAISLPVFRGAAENWWLWAMELGSRTYNALFFYLLMRVLEPAAAGEPFHSTVPNRLRLIGWFVVIGSVLRTLACAALPDTTRVVDFVGRGLFALDPDAIFMGIVLVVLAEVFRRGYVLKAESELTV